MAVAIPVKGVVGLPNNSQKPITNTTWVRARFVSYKKGGLNSQPQAIKVTCPWLVVLSASSTTKNGGHYIVEILLKVALSTINKSINFSQEPRRLSIVSRVLG